MNTAHVREDVLFSVIIACRNAGAHIGPCLRSLASQIERDYEVIIVDGASSDDTLGVIRQSGVPVSRCISEADSGIAEAWNKGLHAAKGKYILFLNADDCWPEDYLSSIRSRVERLDGHFVLYGKTRVINYQGEMVRMVDKRFYRPLMGMGFRFSHTSCMVPAETYRCVGGFDTSLRIAIDTDWLLRAVKKGVPFYKGEHCNLMHSGGLSERERPRALQEFLQAGRRHGLLHLPVGIYYGLHWMLAIYRQKVPA